MQISELRKQASALHGAFSHREGQVFAALDALEEWLGHLARLGVVLEVSPVGEVKAPSVAPAVLAAPDVPIVEVPVPDVEPPPDAPDPATFVNEADVGGGFVDTLNTTDNSSQKDLPDDP